MSQYIKFKKKVVFHELAQKELNLLPRNVQKIIKAIVDTLEIKGRLFYPEGRKIVGQYNIYEIRVRNLGSWRGFYAYLDKELIVILHLFNKKTQKTPRNSLKLAINRLRSIQS